MHNPNRLVSGLKNQAPGKTVKQGLRSAVRVLESSMPTTWKRKKKRKKERRTAETSRLKKGGPRRVT